MPIKTALCMIAKDNERAIIRALNSTEGVFDIYCLQDTGSSDKTREVFIEWCKLHKKPYRTSKKFVGKHYKYVVVNGRKILGEFNKARNNSFDLAKKMGAEFVFWFDHDDVLINPHELKPIVEKMKRDNLHLGVMTYIYAKGDGRIKPIVQKREKLISLSIEGEWKNRVHEVYETKQPARILPIDKVIDKVWVEHNRTGEEVLDTGRRNHLIMKAQEKDDGIDSFSDQMLNSYAYDHWEHKEFEEAIKYYKILLSRDLPPSEFLYYIHVKLAKAYMQLADNNKAIACANDALKITTKIGDPYLILAEAYTNLGSWEEAIYFADKVLRMGMPQTTAPVSEIEYLVIPRRIKINAYVRQGNIEEALKITDELLQVSGDENTRLERNMLRKDLVRKNAILGINNIVQYLQGKNQMKYANRLKEAIPLDLLDDNTVRKIIAEIIYDYRKKSVPVKLEGEKSIVFYAGGGVIEPWDGETDVKRGIGGSEGMCIQLSRELAKLGNKVVVYNNCGNSSGKVFDGVLYEHYEKWNSETKSDVFVSLRDPSVFQRLIRAKKQYLWLHDTTYGDVPTSLFYAPNKIIVLSQAHKHIIKQSHGIEDDSIFFVSRNGLNSIAMDYAIQESKGLVMKRRPSSMVYASSYDRGLDHVLEMWPKIKAHVPEANLKIFYGWNTYDKLMEARKSEEMQRYKSQMIEAIGNSDGVQELGRVSQNDLYKEFAQSSVWFYPTEFYEISCINAMSAQALGCVPVCTPHAALNETVSTKYGVKIELARIADALIYLLKDPKELDRRREPMSKWARKAFDMAKLAKEWDREFNG